MLGGLTQDLGDLVESGELFGLKGIGKGLGSALSQAISEGIWPDDWISLHNDTPKDLLKCWVFLRT